MTDYGVSLLVKDLEYKNYDTDLVDEGEGGEEEGDDDDGDGGEGRDGAPKEEEGTKKTTEREKKAS